MTVWYLYGLPTHSISTWTLQRIRKLQFLDSLQRSKSLKRTWILIERPTHCLSINSEPPHLILAFIHRLSALHTAHRQQGARLRMLRLDCGKIEGRSAQGPRGSVFNGDEGGVTRFPLQTRLRTSQRVSLQLSQIAAATAVFLHPCAPAFCRDTKTLFE